MTLQDAKALRDWVRSAHNIHCIVPLGHGPANYFARIFTNSGLVDLRSRDDLRRYRRNCQQRQRRRLDKWNRDAAKAMALDARSPIERMIDKACGR